MKTEIDESIDLAIVPSCKHEHVTWNTRLPVLEQAEIMGALRAAGLPLAYMEASEGESPRSEIVCVAEVREEVVHALVATPSGLVYRFQPAPFELTFWAFAARHYYWVTFSLADRAHVSTLTGVPVKTMKGRTFSRCSSGLSNVPLNALLAELNAATPTLPRLVDRYMDSDHIVRTKSLIGETPGNAGRSAVG
ncbi:hypothetical protein KY495_20580 [Massilia sp. PAMC28688]|uniref:hypothetical protein n=1 Tax=Massilia sp. PAMC28688 TaxID=2861283 RepID=UPI001C6285FE|nr:hypothetical protein [Massilia sp. PAMC28688]QYF93066.1 hypothetical protein KY495_20580 [Massilia sp. PAMC28688]